MKKSEITMEIWPLSQEKCIKMIQNIIAVDLSAGAGRTVKELPGQPKGDNLNLTSAVSNKVDFQGAF